MKFKPLFYVLDEMDVKYTTVSGVTGRARHAGYLEDQLSYRHSQHQQNLWPSRVYSEAACVVWRPDRMHFPQLENRLTEITTGKKKKHPHFFFNQHISKETGLPETVRPCSHNVFSVGKLCSRSAVEIQGDTLGFSL